MISSFPSSNLFGGSIAQGLTSLLVIGVSRSGLLAYRKVVETWSDGATSCSTFKKSSACTACEERDNWDILLLGIWSWRFCSCSALKSVVIWWDTCSWLAVLMVFWDSLTLSMASMVKECKYDPEWDTRRQTPFLMKHGDDQEAREARRMTRFPLGNYSYFAPLSDKALVEHVRLLSLFTTVVITFVYEPLLCLYQQNLEGYPIKWIIRSRNGYLVLRKQICYVGYVTTVNWRYLLIHRRSQRSLCPEVSDG